MPDIMTIYGPMFYLSRGEGTPPIVAIHGAGGLGRYWGNQLARLSAITRFVTFDLPGHGRSTGPAHQTIEEGAKRVIALLNVLGIQQAVLMGHSMGGAIAQWLALHQPDRVQGLVLVGTGARLRVHSAILDGIYADWNATTRLITEWHYAPGTSPLVLDAATADLRQTNPDILHSDYTVCNAFDIMAEVGNIYQPTLVVVGEHDRMTPPKYAEYLANALPDAQLEVVPQAAHMVMVEQPDAVNAAVRRFVEQLKMEDGR
jgi:pimeloyl-ACP methyl ester carboxylesterase